MRCRKCDCPLLVLIGEVRKVCTRCTADRISLKNKKYREENRDRLIEADKSRYERKKMLEVPYPC